MTKPFSKSTVLEQRRMQAIDWYRQGMKQARIVERLNVSAQSVSRWVESYRNGGRKALKTKAKDGRPKKLGSKDRKRLLQVLAKGPEAHGYQTALWTSERMRKVIKEMFGVSYHPHHIPKLLKQCGWTYQVPSLKAKERDEQAIARWKKHRWPAIKKKPINGVQP
jgi:transposase